jgi:hypothetical protein
MVYGSNGLTLSETTGDYTRKEQQNHTAGRSGRFYDSLNIPLGNIQYGQSREVLLECGQDVGPSSEIYVNLQFNPVDGEKTTLCSRRSVQQATTTFLPQEIAYHSFRARICAFLSSLSPLVNEQHQPLPAGDLLEKRGELEVLITSIASFNYPDDANQSLLTDLAGADPAGQIRLALSTHAFYTRWGKHYLPSLHNAYAKQVCNSFKDAGPLQFGKDSPLFIYCRDKLDKAFDSLPAPKPSVVLKDATGSPIKSKVITMSSYHRPSNPCFAGDCTVKLGGRNYSVLLRDLLPGTSLWTPAGSRKVQQIVKTNVYKQEMCDMGMCRITPYHPVSVDGTWAFPNDIAEKRMLYTGMIYSLLLEKDDNTDAHAVEVGGVLAVTLGHGITNIANSRDARAHPFLGNYERVVESLERLPLGLDGVLVSRGIVRDQTTGLVCGFQGKSIEAENEVEQWAAKIEKRIALKCG